MDAANKKKKIQDKVQIEKKKRKKNSENVKDLFWGDIYFKPYLYYVRNWDFECILL